MVVAIFKEGGALEWRDKMCVDVDIAVCHLGLESGS